MSCWCCEANPVKFVDCHGRCIYCGDTVKPLPDKGRCECGREVLDAWSCGVEPERHSYGTPFAAKNHRDL